MAFTSAADSAFDVCFENVLTASRTLVPCTIHRGYNSNLSPM